MIRVRFLAPGIPLPSIETQAIRRQRGLREFQPDRVQAEITFLPVGATAEALASEMAAWMDAADILVVVKHQLFENFERISRDLIRIARQCGTVLVSHPCDGIEKGANSGVGEFTATQSDAVRPAQLQKPAVKVLNYLSLGLPVVCDSLPAYRHGSARRRA